MAPNQFPTCSLPDGWTPDRTRMRRLLRERGILSCRPCPAARGGIALYPFRSRPMKDAPVQHRIEYAFFRAARRGVLAMPFARVRRFGHGLGSAAHALIPGKRRLALRNLARVFPEKS